MRKFWYAGAVVAGGIFLFGAAAPAQADLLPGTGSAGQQADEQLTGLLESADGATVENPLRYSTLGTTALGAPPLVDWKAGRIGADLKPTLAGESARKARPSLPAADVVGDAMQLNNAGGPQFPFTNTQMAGSPFSGMFGGLPVFSGLLPNGGVPSARQVATPDQTESFDGGLPLLGGLGGMLPVNRISTATPDDDGPDLSGLPAGGMAVLPAVVADDDTTPALDEDPAVQPDQSASSAAPDQSPSAPDPSTSSAADDDPRLHEEPVDGEAAKRAFSPDGRPVAGVDQQYK
ncbi:hypothetical protein [Paractinoplanes durhamensis]|uniref:Secreted protein n=1 Tax=Paractinoplanes durhamensis TaxID=113563 RepID=A0ABQ3YQC2_9ACTN|nr:hypothetical protein [Actinoplanes durhamensis]GID99777.1 hypothetical protein Adu01nite_11280 [Actinoplanes durhamensis]